MARGLPRVLVLVGFLAGAASTLCADFCEDLDVVVGSADDGFVEVRGELVTHHEDPLSDTRVVWQCTQVLSGARTCEVEWQRQAYSYNTYWHKQDAETNIQAYEALEELLGGCGLESRQTSKSGRSRLYGVEGKTYLDITLAYNKRRVRLSFTASGFPNP